FLFNHEINKNHKCKMLFGLNYIHIIDILGLAFKLLKYNSIFKRIIKYFSKYYDEFVYVKIGRSILNSGGLWPAWLIILCKFPSVLSPQSIIDLSFNGDGHEVEIDQFMIISILQRRSAKK